MTSPQQASAYLDRIAELEADNERLHAALEDIIIYSDDYHKAIPLARDALMVNSAALKEKSDE